MQKFDWKQAAIIAIATTVALLGTEYLFPEPLKPDVKSIDYLLKMAGPLNDTLPMKLNDDTEVFTVTASYGTLIINSRLVNVSADEFERSLLDQWRPGTVTYACTNEETRKILLEHDVIVSYTYFDKDKKMLGSIDVLPADCEEKVTEDGVQPAAS